MDNRNVFPAMTKREFSSQVQTQSSGGTKRVNSQAFDVNMFAHQRFVPPNEDPAVQSTFKPFPRVERVMLLPSGDGPLPHGYPRTMPGPAPHEYLPYSSNGKGLNERELFPASKKRG